jgi:hypothetical protein
MRTLAAALVAAFAAAGPAAAADEPPVIRLEVGEERTPLGIMPRCDDLALVAITVDGRGVKGVRPGTTLCSFDRSGGGGARQVYRIVVVPPSPKEEPKGGGAAKPGGA